MQYARKLKCPRHHLAIPGREPWQIEVNEFTKDTNMSDADCKRFGIRKWKYKRDAYGNKIPDYNNHYQPDVSAAFALEHIFDQNSPVCRKCRRCLEGFGRVALIQAKPSSDGRTLQEATVDMLKQIKKELK